MMTILSWVAPNRKLYSYALIVLLSCSLVLSQKFSSGEKSDEAEYENAIILNPEDIGQLL